LSRKSKQQERTEELELEKFKESHRHKEKLAFASIINRIIGLFYIAMPFFFSWLIVDSIGEHFGGKTTLFGFIIETLGKIEITSKVSILFGFMCLIYGLVQRRLRMRTVERLQSRNQELEKLIDPKRSTSGLTPMGESQPEDRL